MLKEMLVLAKSWKNGGYCVGGIELTRGNDGCKYLSDNWLRPVTSTRDGKHQGDLPKPVCEHFSVFDIIEIDVEPASCTPGQPENWLLKDQRIRKLSRLFRMDGIYWLVQQAGKVWFDVSTMRDDQVSCNTVLSACAQRSLMVIQPQDLFLTLEVEPNSYGLRKRVYASFSYEGRAYQRIPLTDPAIAKVFCNQFPAQPGVQYQKQLRNQDRYWLTLSLSPEFRGNHYILVAAVLDHSGYLNRRYG